jgi:hypothetical protein
LRFVGQTGSLCHIQRVSTLQSVDLRQIVASNRFIGHCIAIVVV